MSARHSRAKDAGGIHRSAGESVAARFMRRLIARANSLCVMPTRHRIRNELQVGLRAVSVEKYIIFYQVTGDKVFILRVLHSARDITSELFSN